MSTISTTAMRSRTVSRQPLQKVDVWLCWTRMWPPCFGIRGEVNAVLRALLQTMPGRSAGQTDEANPGNANGKVRIFSAAPLFFSTR